MKDFNDSYDAKEINIRPYEYPTNLLNLYTGEPIMANCKEEGNNPYEYINQEITPYE